MPELPEVQTIVSDLNRKLKGHTIQGIWTDWPKSFFSPLKKVKQEIKGRRVKGVRRRAKNILIDLTGGKTLLIHLKMTGHLLYRNKDWRKQTKKDHPWQDPDNQYIRTIFSLDQGKELAFSDLRRFGEIILYDTVKENKLKRLKNLGHEPLEKKFTFSIFRQVLKGKKRKIKSVLLDQTAVAGIGNIYADEILWEAKIHPQKQTDSLTLTQERKIFLALKKVLHKAVKNRGTSVSDYRDLAGKKGRYQDLRRVYQRKNETCFRCGRSIKKIKINNRGTYFCPKCQRL